MNKKLIAAAVSAAVMAPVAAQADVTVYGRINNAIQMSDEASSSRTVTASGDDRTDVSSVSSRFGIRASSDLGNGLTATGQYEFSTTTDKELSNPADLRIGTVGLSGSFGSVTIGNQWSAFYNTVGSFIDPTYTLGAVLYSSVANGVYRSSNTIAYSNSFGPVSMQLDLRLNDGADDGESSGANSDDNVAEKANGNGYGLGIRYSHDIVTLALAIDSEETANAAGVKSADTDRIGIAANFTLGAFDVILGWHETEVDNVGGADTTADQTQLFLSYNFSDQLRGQLGYGEAENASNHDTEALTLGLYYNMGGGMRLYYEGISFDNDTANTDFTTHLFGMRYDF